MADYPDGDFARDLKTLFDLAVNSMDFGSGFMDHNEVLVLRRFAEFITGDPKNGTPSNFRASFAHDFIQGRSQTRWPRHPKGYGYDNTKPPIETFFICEHCSRREGNPVHHGVSVTEPTSSYEE